MRETGRIGGEDEEEEESGSRWAQKARRGQLTWAVPALVMNLDQIPEFIWSVVSHMTRVFDLHFLKVQSGCWAENGLQRA